MCMYVCGMYICVCVYVDKSQMSICDISVWMYACMCVYIRHLFGKFQCKRCYRKQKCIYISISLFPFASLNLFLEVIISASFCFFISTMERIFRLLPPSLNKYIVNQINFYTLGQNNGEETPSKDTKSFSKSNWGKKSNLKYQKFIWTEQRIRCVCVCVCVGGWVVGKTFRILVLVILTSHYTTFDCLVPERLDDVSFSFSYSYSMLERFLELRFLHFYSTFASTFRKDNHNDNDDDNDVCRILVTASTA